MQEFLYRNVFKRPFVVLIFFLNFSLLFSEDTVDVNKERDSLTLKQKAYLKELEVSTDDDLKKWAEKEKIGETDVFKIRELLLKKFGIDPKFFTKNGTTDVGRYKIIIENTDDLENFTYELTKDENIILRGKVNLTIEDTRDNLKHNIKADRIVFNKKTRKLSSNGNIQYTLDLKSSDKIYFYGNELFVDFDSQNFLLKDGIVQKQIHQDLMNHIVSFGGKVLKKLENDTTILEDAFITTSKLPDPYYSVKASKIWILPSGDFGLLNAVFYIGKVPIFYFPFFFRPGDSLFFNPTLGYSPRKGLSFFNTIYLFGTKVNEENSFLDFDFNSLYNSNKKEYLRNGYLTYFFAEDRKETLSKDYVKLMIDAYSGLGFYAGIDYDVGNTLDQFRTFKGTFGLGFTRTLYNYNNSGFFFPYKRDAVNQSLFSFNNLNKSNIFGTEVPFRYLFQNKIEFLASSTSFSIDFEYYSDPYVVIDFKNRLESSSFFTLLNSQKDLSERDNKINLFTWNLSSLDNITFENDISLNYRLDKLGLEFKSSDYNNGYNIDPSKEIEDPTSKWFYLESIYMPQMDFNFQKYIYDSNASREVESNTLNIIEPEADNIDLSKEKEKKEFKKTSPLISPETINLTGQTSKNSFYVRFELSPYIKNNIFFDSSNIRSPKDFDYKIKNYLFDIKNKTSLRTHFDLYNRLLTFDNTIYLNTVEYNPLTKDFNLVETNKNSEHSIITQTSLSIYPLMNFPSFARTMIKYDNKMNLYGFYTKYDYSSGTLLNRHDSVFVASPSAFYQNINADFIYDYKFFTAKWSGILKNTFEESYYTSDLRFFLEFMYLSQEFGIGVKYNKKISSSTVSTSPSKIFEMYPPLYYKITAKYYDYFNIKFLLAYDPSINKISEISSELNVYDFRFTFTAKDDFELNYSNLTGDFVKLHSSTKLVPYEISTQYKKDLYNFEFFNKKFEFGIEIDSGWKMNLQKFIDNELWAELIFKFKYLDFIEIYFSTRSHNTKTYRYFKGYADQIGIPTVNFFEDLLKSFNFFNLEDRKDSFFKIKRFSTGFKFNFYDWKLVGEYSLTPDLILQTTGIYSYVWRNSFTFYISWNFFPTMKSSFESNKNTDYELIINRPSSR